MGRAKKQAKKLQRGSDGGQSASYMGICQLTDQPGRLHRRIDIKVQCQSISVHSYCCCLRVLYGLVHREGITTSA
jgi:hypothetical protein